MGNIRKNAAVGNKKLAYKRYESDDKSELETKQKKKKVETKKNAQVKKKGGEKKGNKEKFDDLGEKDRKR